MCCTADLSFLSHLLCTLVPSSPPCRPLSHWGHSWSDQRSHRGLCRTCCRKVRSRLNHSESEAGTPSLDAVHGDGMFATVHRGSTLRRGGLAQLTDLGEERRRKDFFRLLRLKILIRTASNFSFTLGLPFLSTYITGQIKQHLWSCADRVSPLCCRRSRKRVEEEVEEVFASGKNGKMFWEVKCGQMEDRTNYLAQEKPR